MVVVYFVSLVFVFYLIEWVYLFYLSYLSLGYRIGLIYFVKPLVYVFVFTVFWFLDVSVSSTLVFYTLVLDYLLPPVVTIFEFSFMLNCCIEFWGFWFWTTNGKIVLLWFRVLVTSCLFWTINCWFSVLIVSVFFSVVSSVFVLIFTNSFYWDGKTPISGYWSLLIITSIAGTISSILVVFDLV